MTLGQLQNGIKQVYTKWYEYLCLCDQSNSLIELNRDIAEFEKKLHKKYSLPDVPKSLIASTMSTSQVETFQCSINKEMSVYGDGVSGTLDNLLSDYSALVKEYTDNGGKGFYDVIANVITSNENSDSLLLASIGKMMNDGIDVIIIREESQPDRELVSKGLSASRIYSLMLPSSQLGAFSEAVKGSLLLKKDISFYNDGLRVLNNFVLPDIAFSGKCSRDTLSAVNELFVAAEEHDELCLKDDKFGLRDGIFSQYGYGLSNFNMEDDRLFDLTDAFKSAFVSLSVYDKRYASAGRPVVRISSFDRDTMLKSNGEYAYISKTPKSVLQPESGEAKEAV